MLIILSWHVWVRVSIARRESKAAEAASRRRPDPLRLESLLGQHVGGGNARVQVDDAPILPDHIQRRDQVLVDELCRGGNGFEPTRR